VVVSGATRSGSRRILAAGAVVTLIAVCWVKTAGAAVTHDFNAELSGNLSEGVPSGSGASLTGALSGVNALTVDSGHLWIAEKRAGSTTTRVDEFDDSSGAFLQQLNEVGTLTTLDDGIAVGHGAGEEEVYVGAAQEGQGVIAVFASGVLQATWNGADTPAGAFTQGEAQELKDVAVDPLTNPLTDWAAGDVYVASESGSVVDVFKPEAGGKEPAKVVAQLTGICKAPGEECSGGEVVPFSQVSNVAVSPLNGEVFVVDSHQRIDIFKPTAPSGYQYVGELIGPPPSGDFERINSVAVDGSSNGDIYVSDGPQLIDEFSAAGLYLGHLTGTPARAFDSVESVAVDPVSHEVFVGDFDQEKVSGSVDAFGSDLVIPDVVTGAAEDVGAAEAMLTGSVNPQDEGSASCEFVYGTTSEFGQSVPCSEDVPNGSSLVPVHANPTGLAPDTTYYYRLQASNANGTNPGEVAQNRSFTTGGPGLHGASVSKVTADSASLEVTVDPHGLATSVYFEYGPSTNYGDVVPAAPGVAIGSGNGDVEVVPENVEGLSAGSTYHYRVIVLSEVEPGVVKSFVGSDQKFVTPTAAGGSALPDGRQWEMVSPPEKHGALLDTIGQGRVTEASASGYAMSYVASAPTEAGASGFANLVQVLSTRGPGGWVSKDISTQHEAATGAGGGELRMFSTDLSSGVVQPIGPFTPSLSSEASEQTAYVRDNSTGTLTPLVTGCPSLGTAECAPSVEEHANVPPGTAFGEEGQCPSPPPGNKEKCGPEAVDATPDLSHIVLKASAQLLHGSNSGGLYEWSDAALAPVSGEAGGNPNIGFENGVAKNAVSSDGSRVFWSELGGALYLRDMTLEKTVRIDTPEEGAGEGPITPRFQAASSDGSRVFFTDNQKLVKGAGGAGTTTAEGDLYECEVAIEEGEPRCHLSDLTPALPGEDARVLDQIVGASEDGSWIYFVADGKLAPGAVKGTCGAEGSPAGARCNLYLWHNGTIELVTILAGEDYPVWNGSNSKGLLLDATARVSPDGQWLTFMSQLGLMGYDTRDLASGTPDEEVYMFDADRPVSEGVAGVTDNPLCASCNPTGERPVGVEYGKLMEGVEGGVGIWHERQRLAGNIPTWTAYSSNHEAVYQSRFLSDNGRLFFNSSDGLVPDDSNGTGDVYEFEPGGVGGCNTGTATGSVVYVPASGGCVGLISSGTSSEESDFLDASATGGRDAEGHEGGGDVFFLTTARLSSADFDSALDVYDAHECSSASPCIAPSTSTAQVCESEQTCKGSPAPQPDIFGSPPSATQSGAGNHRSVVVRQVVKSAAQIRAEKLARALKSCKSKHRKHKRRACEARARKQYGPKAKAKKKPVKASDARGGGGK
jgi:hypothetical protein